MKAPQWIKLNKSTWLLVLAVAFIVVIWLVVIFPAISRLRRTVQAIADAQTTQLSSTQATANLITALQRKNELIEQLAKKVHLTKRATRQTVDTLLDMVRVSVAKGDKVVLSGFGTFRVRQRAARRGRNPQTGAPIQIGNRKTPGFTAGKSFKKLVR